MLRQPIIKLIGSNPNNTTQKTFPYNRRKEDCIPGRHGVRPIPGILFLVRLQALRKRRRFSSGNQTAGRNPRGPGRRKPNPIGMGKSFGMQRAGKNNNYQPRRSNLREIKRLCHSTLFRFGYQRRPGDWLASQPAPSMTCDARV